MPLFSLSLDRVAQLLEEFILAGGLRLQTAMRTIHSAGRVHADIKSANVFLNNDSEWSLGDFGSCVMAHEKIRSCTEVRQMRRQCHHCD
jgi:serine/threonine protein kinase